MPSWFSHARAILACGLLVGVAVTPTLASWNDAEVAGAQVTAATGSSIEVQTTSQEAPGQWADHPPGAPLMLPLNPTAVLPGHLTVNSIGLRTPATEPSSGVVTLAPPVVTGPGSSPPLAPYLSYRAYRSSTQYCTDTSVPPPGTDAEWIVGGSTTYLPMTAGTDSAPVPLAGAKNGAPGAAAWVCVQVRLALETPSNLQGATTDLTFILRTGAVS